MIYAFSLYPKQTAANPLELESRLLEDAPRSHILDRCHRLDALKTKCPERDSDRIAHGGSCDASTLHRLGYGVPECRHELLPKSPVDRDLHLAGRFAVNLDDPVELAFCFGTDLDLLLGRQQFTDLLNISRRTRLKAERRGLVAPARDIFGVQGRFFCALAFGGDNSSRARR